jgi:hypothetical protein
MSGRYRHSFASNAQHIRDQIMRHYQLIRLKEVVVDEQPPAKLLFD